MTPAELVGETAAVALALSLAQAGWQSLVDRPGHAAAVAAYQLLPDWAVTPAARLLPALNILASGLLLGADLRQAGAAIATGLLLLYTAAIGINLSRGRVRIECGCGGPPGQFLSPALLARNAALLALCAVAGFAPPARALLPVIFGGLAGFAGAVLYLAAGQLHANTGRAP